MRYARIVVDRYGGPNELRLVEEDCPEPKSGEVRVQVLAAGVSLPDLMMREGIHPEKPRVPFTPGWDLVGVVDRLGKGVSGIEPGQRVAALPVHGAYAEFLCLPKRELFPIPAGLDPAESVSLILNYVTAYQMMHRSASVAPGRRILVHAAAGGVGSALLQLGRLARLDMYGTCSPARAAAVSEMGGIPIDYRHLDFVKEIRRLTGDGVDVVFDGIGGQHMWRSRSALRPGGKVVVYGLTSSLNDGRLSGPRTRLNWMGRYAAYILGGWVLPGGKRVIPYSIQWIKRLRPAWFRRDLSELFELLQQNRIRPLVAHRFPLADARRAHELLGSEGVTGKIVLLCDRSTSRSAP